MSEPGGEDESVGELVQRLIDEGKAYAAAEFELAKLRIQGKAAGYRRAAALAVVAVLFAFGGVVALCLMLVLTLSALLGPFAGGLIASLMILATAAGLAMLAKRAFNRADD